MKEETNDVVGDPNRYENIIMVITAVIILIMGYLLYISYSSAI